MRAGESETEPVLLALFSAAALGLGPLLAASTRRSAWATSWLDRFVVVSVCGLALFHLLPHAVARIGVTALVAAATGFALAHALEHAPGGASAASGRLVPLVIVCFGVHALLDGAALAEHADSSHTRALALAIAIHRLPEGALVWSIGCSAMGPRAAAALLVLLGIATLMGFFAGEALLEGSRGPALALVQAVVVGSVLDVVLHRWRHSRTSQHG